MAGLVNRIHNRLRSHVYLLAIILNSINCAGQIFGLQYRAQFFYSTALSFPADDKFRVLACGAVPGKYAYGKIFIFNENLLLTDSVSLLKGVLAQRNEPLHLNDRLYWPVAFFDTLSTSQGCCAVLELDTNYHHIALHKLGTVNSNFVSAVSLIKINNHFYSSYEMNGSASIIYKLDQNWNKIDSLLLPCALYDLAKMGNALVITVRDLSSQVCNATNNVKVLLADTLLSVYKCKSLDSISQVAVLPSVYHPVGIQNFPGSAKAVVISDKRMMITGSSAIPNGTQTVGKCLLDENLEFLTSTVVATSSTVVNHFDYSNFAAFNKKQLLTVACRGNDFSKATMAQTQPTRIVLTQLDTVGNIIWTGDFGGDMFYRPVSVVYRPDGNLLVAGWRYDSTTMHNPAIWESFLLKVNPGDTILTSLKNQPRSVDQLHVYPNPFSDRCYINTSGMKGCVLRVTDIHGRNVFETPMVKQSIVLNLPDLLPGLYIITISNQSEQIVSRKLVIKSNAIE